MSTYLAFDLGASGSRAILGRFDGGIMAMEEIHRFPTPVVEEGGHIYWDTDFLWKEMQTGLQIALKAAPDLRSLSVDSWAIDYVPLDVDGRPLRRPHCYRDPRTRGVMDRALEIVSAEAIFRHTGIQFLPFNTLYQVLADREAGWEDVGLVDCHLTIADYFNYLFSGRKTIEVSMASTTQMMDVHARSWSDPLLEAFELDSGAWPDIVESGTALGPSIQAPNVMVVASCSHDTACAVAAAPAATAKKWAYISCGTWSLLGSERRDPLLTDAARDAGFTNEAGIDGTIRFLKNLTGLWALQECAREWGGVDWGALEQETRAAGHVTARVDLEDPLFLERGGMEARLKDYCVSRGTPFPTSRGEISRVILESIAAGYARAVSDLNRVTGEPVETIYLFGGGARNKLLCELTALRCGLTVVAGPFEATTLGNLLIQARTMGDLPQGSTIRDVAVASSDCVISER